MKRIAALAFVLSLAGQAHAGDTADLVYKASLVADTLYSTNGGRDFSMDGRVAELMTRSMDCVKTAKTFANEDAIVFPSKNIRTSELGDLVHKLSEDGNTISTTAGDLKSWCARAVQKSVAGDLQSIVIQLVDYNGKTIDGQAISVDWLLDLGKKCNEKVELADAARLGPDWEIELYYKKTIKVGDVKARVCDPINKIASDRLVAEKAAVEEKFAPWRKALKGDRIRLFEERNMINVWIRGKGGVKLETPEAMAKAKLWFETFNFDGGDGWTHWRVVRYEFKGDKLVKGPTEKTGRGNTPPESAYK